MSDEQRNTLPASLTELARIAKQYSLDTARWHQGLSSLDFYLYTRGDGGERFNFSGINEDQAYALGMIFQALPVLVEMAQQQTATYKDARGVLGWQEGDEPAEDTIRRIRGDDEESERG